MQKSYYHPSGILYMLHSFVECLQMVLSVKAAQHDEKDLAWEHEAQVGTLPM